MSNQHPLWQAKALRALDQKAETQDVDFKEDLSEHNDRLKEHINAFGNNEAGGLFVFGVRANYRLSTKAINQDQIIKRVTDLARDTQIPSLNVLVHHLNYQSNSLLCIEIHPGERQPVFIKDRSPWGGDGCFRRSGSSTVPMSEQEMRDRLMRSEQYFKDESPLDGTSLENLDLETIEEFVPPFKKQEGFSQPNMKVLLENKIVSSHGRASPIPTLAGWLSFTSNPQSLRTMKNASIEFQQFRGMTRDEPLKKLEIVGTLPQQVDLAIATIQQNIWTIPKIQGIRREDIPAYDEVTLREAVINALVHRDYSQLHQPVKIALFSDRLEIENPGGLLPGLTPLNLIHKRAWRNPTLASLMDNFGLGEMDGQGIDRIFTGSRRIKVPAPQLIDDRRTFKIILSAPKDFENYTPEEKRLTVLILLILEHEIDNESIRNAFGIDISKASTLLKTLVGDELIRRTTSSMKYARYRLTQVWEDKIFGT